jgi:hypothetical protein
MTTEDLIPLLEQAGISQEIWFEHHRSIERLVFLVVAVEREACAKVCDDIDAENDGLDMLATVCADAIRARGEV